ncbi:MAG: hypothetical protein JWN14_3352, partial [Chthonomonadales bacterium]|nr:hypothetical protein [Chthonomonadales bacterium]
TYMARAVAGGAAGYLLKGVEYDEMPATLRGVDSPQHSNHSSQQAGFTRARLFLFLTIRPFADISCRYTPHTGATTTQQKTA